MNTRTESIYKNLKIEISVLSEQISTATQPSEKFFAKIEKWLRLKSALHAYQICRSFERGSLFYRTDPNHAPIPHPDIPAASSLSSIERIYYLSAQGPAALSFSYKIKEGKKPSKVLEQLLFSNTLLECNSVTQITYYLSLLDLFRLMHGKEAGTQKFDTMFSAKADDTHDFYRLRIGNMGEHTSNNPTLFSPIHYLTTQNTNPISLKDLRKDPDRYIGSKFYFKNSPNYPMKHPFGEAAGWNVIFWGLNNDNEPLFLCANFKGKQIVMTASDMNTVLTEAYNQFPDIKQKTFAHTVCHKSDLGGMMNYMVFFDMKKIKELVSDFTRFEKSLSQYCDSQYSKMSMLTHIHYDKRMSSFLKIAGTKLQSAKQMNTQDDIGLNRFFDKVHIKQTSKDDIHIHYKRKK